MLSSARTTLKVHSAALRAARCSAVRRASSSATKATPARRALASASVAVAAGTAFYLCQNVTYNDAPNFLGNIKDAVRSSEEDTGPVDWMSASVDPAMDDLVTLVWGSNKEQVLIPDAPKVDGFKYPMNAEFLRNAALRDLSLQDTHAAAVDARGNVYQWGSGFSDAAAPTLTLTGKNITSIATTATRVFALSASGRVYVLSSSSAHQELTPGAPTPASDSWFGTGFLRGEDSRIAFGELTPAAGAPLARGERFVSLTVGEHHLLALTSAGRAFAHPLDVLANSHGQLGVRHVSIPDVDGPASGAKAKARRDVELTPTSVLRDRNPALRSQPALRIAPPTAAGEADDAALLPPRPSAAELANILWCDALFEVPALRGVRVAQLAAGAKSSFARTSEGRVLAWGANEYGQLGIGVYTNLKTVLRPTEVVFTRQMGPGVRAECLDISCGGDLTLFTMERSDPSGTRAVDVLSAGNGQWGGLGTAVFSNAQGAPARVKNVSGLVEFSEADGCLQPIRPHAIAVSATGHVLLTLDTLSRAGSSASASDAAAAPGRDFLAWGANGAGELGNGRRSSLAVPTGLRFPGRASAETGAVVSAGPSALPGARAQGGRFMLTERSAKTVRDLEGKVWKKNVKVEQRAVAGPRGSVVYWQIV